MDGLYLQLLWDVMLHALFRQSGLPGLFLAPFWWHARSHTNLVHILGGNGVIQNREHHLENGAFLSPCLCFPAYKMASHSLESARDLCWRLVRGHGEWTVNDRAHFLPVPRPWLFHNPWAVPLLFSFTMG